MLAIDAPIAQFFDLDGTPLTNGYLFFGTASQNPEISPITVYWDQAGTQPAAQPVRTLNGYPVRAGRPATVYANGDFSLIVRNSRRELVLYTPSSQDALNDANLQAQIDALVDDIADLSQLELTASKIVSLENFASLFVGGDHTPALVEAISEARIVLIPNTRTWSFSGTFPIASGCSIIFVGKPTINMTVDNNERGLYFADGTENAHVSGDALVNLTVNTAGTDGSFNGAFTFSTFYYTTDPTGVRRCSIKGDILVDCQGPANGKPFSIYGYTEDVEIDGLHGSGTTNIAFTCHWSGNGSSGVLPTKTWHPHRIVLRRLRSDNSGSNLNSLVLSSVGKVTVEDCGSRLVEEGLFVFAGDYGYTYAANIGQNDACEVYICRHRTRAAADYGLSIDMISSGLNGSPIWVGSDHNARVVVDGFSVVVPAANTATNGIVASGLRVFDLRSWNFRDEGSNNTEYALELFGVTEAYIQGKAIARNGVLIRNCGEVNWHAHVEMFDPNPDIAEYGISASATSETTTTSGAVAAGGESITLASVATVMGPGGILRYNDGSVDHEMDILTSTKSGGAQTISITPAPVTIPDGSTVTLIQTIKALNIGAVEINGFGVGLRLTGSSTAKVRNVHLAGTKFKRCGVYDVEAAAVQGFRAIGTVHTHGGQRTTTTNRYGIFIGSNAASFIVNGAHFDRNNTRLRYLINIDNSATRGYVGNCLFESINSSATNPAAIFKNAATEVTIGTNHTVTGITPVYP